MAMIHATAIRKKYGDLEVLKGVELQVAKGEIVSIVGASGAGKTTLLQILGTLERADQGTLSINGEEVTKLGSKALRSVSESLASAATLFASNTA